ncbi:MAG TPA: DUF3482 domain-containing protein [Pusillimonas sp.]|jgi:hypothetical protein|nr:GTPase SAR1 [Pusillimonas sp.]MBC41788.1 GTPase SAR1 [Pusillimonas sp.]HBT34183.1 DUF3482 domain-containing protein [Pusillimonas sp.]|tara:strand:- start:182509 stop:183921 length:1413 start_codon:yes stop_codon:yes gene_type:complete
MQVNANTPLRLAVVGHTNTGKTSLLRTLTRNPDFGQVDNRPGTTRHVETVSLQITPQISIQLLDTPGLEEAMELGALIDQISPPEMRLDGPERIERFLQSPEGEQRFEQEARVLRGLLTCHAGLYVIDARDPVLSKHKEELAILAQCARPLLPVLNFIHTPGQRTEEWRQALSRLGLHAMVEFDTIAPALNGEDQLYNKLALLLDSFSGLLRKIQASVAEHKQQRHEDALNLVADLLIDAAAFRLSAPPEDEEIELATQQLRETIRQREQQCVVLLLQRFNFRNEDYAHHALPLEGEKWGMDLFSPQALKDAGIEVGLGAATGAAAGFTVDLITGGLSMGAGTLAGAAAGGLWQGAERYGRRLLGRLRGYREISLSDQVLRVLAARQLTLLKALEHRGHAATQPIEIKMSEHAIVQNRQLPDALQEARANPAWSSMSAAHEDSLRRRRLVSDLARQLAHEDDSTPAAPGS